MARKSKKPTLKFVVRGIRKLIKDLKGIRSAVPKEAKALKLKIKRLKGLKVTALRICRSKSLNLR
jgi:hypothetical protein